MSVQNLLRKEFLRRKSKNPSYSLRAFSQSIGLPSGRTSEILNGKRRITESNASKILNRLNLNLQERVKWQNTIKGVKNETLHLEEAQFCLIADPIHYSILCLMETSGFEKYQSGLQKKAVAIRLSLQIDWMARRLHRPKIEIEMALENLKTLLFVKIEMNFFILTLESALETTTDIPSAALRESHRKSLLASVNKLESVPVELRDMTSMVMAIDVNNLAKAKKLIREFRKKLSELLEDGDKTEVYELNVQLVPVTVVNP